MKQLIVCFLLLFYTGAYCQDSLELDPVNITSSRINQHVSKTGRSVTIISGKTLQNIPSQSIDDLLKYAAGMNVQQRGPGGSQADIVLRGGTFQQVLVLLDGMRTNDPITGHFSAYFPILPDQIERIEILKGPSAALYGPEAVGGVIHIISKTYAAQQVQDKKKDGNFSLGAGEYGLLNSSISLNESGKRSAFSIGGMSTNAKGQTLRGDNRGYFYNQLASGKLALFLKNDWKLFLSSAIDSRDFAAQNFYTIFSSDTATEKVKTWWNHFRVEKNSMRSTHSLDFTFKKTSDHYVFNPASLPNDNRSGYLSLQYVYLNKRFSNITWQAGSNAEQKQIRSNDRGSHNNSTAAAFGFISFQKNMLSLNGGARIQHDENYGTKLLPQASLAYKVQSLVFFANAGRSARSADFTERFNNYNKPLVNSGNIGNPALDAETGWTYEAGATISRKNVRLTASAFLRDQENVIDWVPTPYDQMPRPENLNAGGNFALAKNISTLQTTGIDANLYFTHNWNDVRITANLAATFLHSSSSQQTPSFYILSHAKTVFQQTISLTTRNFGLTCNGLYALRNPQQAPAIKADVTREYYVTNLKAFYRIKWITAYVQVQNLGDKKYSDLLGSSMPGRWTSAGINISY